MMNRIVILALVAGTVVGCDSKNKPSPLTPIGEPPTNPVVMQFTPQGSEFYDLVVRAVNDGIERALLLGDQLLSHESWSGSMLCVKDHAGSWPLHCTALVPTSGNGHYSFNDVRANIKASNPIEISLWLQPGTAPGAEVRRVPVVLNRLAMMFPGQDEDKFHVLRPGDGRQEYRLTGPFPRDGRTTTQSVDGPILSGAVEYYGVHKNGDMERIMDPSVEGHRYDYIMS